MSPRTHSASGLWERNPNLALCVHNPRLACISMRCSYVKMISSDQLSCRCMWKIVTWFNSYRISLDKFIQDYYHEHVPDLPWWRQKWKPFPCYWPFVRESTSYRWIPLTKASDTELWCFLWPAPEQTVEQTIEALVIWDAIVHIMTSLGCTTPPTHTNQTSSSSRHGLLDALPFIP